MTRKSSITLDNGLHIWPQSMGGAASRPSSPAECADALAEVGYLADEGLVAATFLAARLRRPLFFEGEPGVGKTALAEALSQALGVSLIRLQCYAGVDVTQALYDWSFPRQLLALRALSLRGGEGVTDTATLYDEEFLVVRPILRALTESPSVVLIDEIDRADDEFEAFLLEVLDSYSVTIPELGPIVAAEPPLVILTSNRTREAHDASGLCSTATLASRNAERGSSGRWRRRRKIADAAGLPAPTAGSEPRRPGHAGVGGDQRRASPHSARSPPPYPNDVPGGGGGRESTQPLNRSAVCCIDIGQRDTAATLGPATRHDDVASRY